VHLRVPDLHNKISNFTFTDAKPVELFAFHIPLVFYLQGKSGEDFITYSIYSVGNPGKYIPAGNRFRTDTDEA